jgi:hypothetical protein
VLVAETALSSAPIAPSAPSLAGPRWCAPWRGRHAAYGRSGRGGGNGDGGNGGGGGGGGGDSRASKPAAGNPGRRGGRAVDERLANQWPSSCGARSEPDPAPLPPATSRGSCLAQTAGTRSRRRRPASLSPQSGAAGRMGQIGSESTAASQPPASLSRSPPPDVQRPGAEGCWSQGPRSAPSLSPSAQSSAGWRSPFPGRRRARPETAQARREGSIGSLKPAVESRRPLVTVTVGGPSQRSQGKLGVVALTLNTLNLKP